MTLAFWDSSALVKLLVEETGTKVAVALWDGSTALVASRLVLPEVSAALAAATRARRLDEARARAARTEWRRYVAALDLLDLTADLAARGADLAAAHDLSGAEAVHLAAALALREAELVAVTWDRRLAAAARAEGIMVVPEPT
ncbi:MAG: PIN domain-containing protein [Microbacteriaceae bacterium]